MLSALFRERSVTVPWENDTGWGTWPGDAGPATVAGPAVTEANAQRLLAVYGSASFITDEISTLPILVDTDGVVGGGDDVVRPTWIDNPSEGLDRIAWLTQIVWSLLLSGNAYIAVIGDPFEPSALDPIDPAKVRVERVNGRKSVLVNGQRPGFGVVHIPGRMRPGDLVGMSPVEWARQTIGLGIAAETYGAEFFSGPGNMDGVVQAPGPMQPDTMRNLAQQWQAKRRKGGRGLPGVLQMGATWQATGVTNEQAQFLSTRQFTDAQIAGLMFLLDPSDLGIPVAGTSLTYGNLEQRNTRRLQVALMPWIRRIEMQLSQLLRGNAKYRFDVDSRLRGNTRESYETLQIAIETELMTAEFASQTVLGLPPEARQGIMNVSPVPTPRRSAQ